MMYVLDIFPLQNVQINFVWRIYDVNTTINTHPVTNEKLIKDRERETQTYHIILRILCNIQFDGNFLMS